MHIKFLLDRFEGHPKKDAFVWLDKTYSYEWVLNEIDTSVKAIQSGGICPGTVVAIEAEDFSPYLVCFFLH